jgi:uncharacterized membrane protein YgcG
MGGPVVIEAVKTTASTGAIWTIVIVAVVTLAFWLAMVAWADMHPFVRSRQVSDLPGPVLGGMHLGSGGRSVSPNREAPSVLTNVDDLPYDQRDYEPEHDEAAQWSGGVRGTGEPWIPVQRRPESQPSQPTRPAADHTGAASPMPTPRTGEADTPERAAAGGSGDRGGGGGSGSGSGGGPGPR